MSGADIADEVRAALIEAGAEVGNGTLYATITRRGEPDHSTYPPTPGEPTDYTAVAMIGSYSARDRDGTNITERDVQVTITVPLVDALGNETEPQNGDTLDMSDGTTYHLENVDPEKPFGEVLVWECRARAGE